MRRVLIASVVTVLAMAATACGKLQPPTSPSEFEASTGISTGITTAATAATAPDPAVALAENLAFCVAETNRYRATVGLEPLVQSLELETYATVAAEHDHTARTPHQWFGLTQGGGVSRSEIETLWWKNQPVRKVIVGGLAQMWKQGPGGTHYDIITKPWTETGCGIYVSNGEVTIAQEFR